MITQKQIKEVLEGYDLDNLTIGVLGGHSALDVLRGAKKLGFKTVAVCQKGREKTYATYYKTRDNRGIVDDVILVDKFSDIVKTEVQEELRKRNTLFVHNRYFWVYCNFPEIENDFLVPILGTRDMVKLEERDVEKNQYWLLEESKIRIPYIFESPKDIDRLVLVKVPEATRSYERAFFLCNSPESYKEKSDWLLEQGTITQEALQTAVIEEFIVGAQINLNFYYSPITEELELMGTDMRRQTNLDGLLRIPAPEQEELLEFIKPKMVETGHVAVTTKESMVEKMFTLGEQFVKTTQKEHTPGIIGAFALQGAVVAEDGKEDIVIFDVSMRIPGSPGTMFTPYTAYLYGEPKSYGERIAMDVKEALELKKLHSLCT